MPGYGGAGGAVGRTSRGGPLTVDVTPVPPVHVHDRERVQVGPRGLPGDPGTPGDRGPVGRTGPSGIAATAEATFAVPITPWTFAHDLGFPPAVTCYGPDGGQVIGRITECTATRVTVEFFRPATGRMTLS